MVWSCLVPCLHAWCFLSRQFAGRPNQRSHARALLTAKWHRYKSNVEERIEQSQSCCTLEKTKTIGNLLTMPSSYIVEVWQSKEHSCTRPVVQACSHQVCFMSVHTGNIVQILAHLLSFRLEKPSTQRTWSNKSQLCVKNQASKKEHTHAAQQFPHHPAYIYFLPRPLFRSSR